MYQTRIQVQNAIGVSVQVTLKSVLLVKLFGIAVVLARYIYICSCLRVSVEIMFVKLIEFDMKTNSLSVHILCSSFFLFCPLILITFSKFRSQTGNCIVQNAKFCPELTKTG